MTVMIKPSPHEV